LIEFYVESIYVEAIHEKPLTIKIEGLLDRVYAKIKFTQKVYAKIDMLVPE
jgi:hypothetical protein